MAALALTFDLLARDNASKAFNDVGRAAEGAGKKGEGFGATIGKAMGVAAGAIAAVGLASFGKDLIGLASNAEQSMGGVEAVFKGYADTVKASAAAADTALGLSANSYRELATVIGSQLKNAGVPMAELGGSTDKLISQGADLAAMFGGTTQEAVDALSSALKGEMDPIERYGISLNDAAMKAEAMSLGLYSGKGNLDANAKAMAVMSLVTKQGADSIGAFGRESDTAAGRQARATAEWENLRTTLGEKLLPVWTGLMGFVSSTVLPGLEKVGAVAGQAFDILFRGDYTGGPLGAEDSPIVDKLFNIRDGLVTVGGVAKQAFDILFRGDFKGGPLDEDSGTVDVLFRLRDAFIGLAGFLTGTVVPGFAAVGGAVLSVVGFFREHETAAKALGVVVAGVVAAVVAAWIAQGVVATTNAVISVAAWFTTATASTTAATIQSRSTAQIVVGWIAMGAQAMIQAARMAAAWFIALGPVGWAIAAIIGVVAVVVANWSKVKEITAAVWSWVSDKIVAVATTVQSWVTTKFGALRDSVVGIFTAIRDTVGRVWDGLLDKVRQPVRLVFGFVNDKMVGPINGLLGKFPGGLKIPTLPGFAGGGYTGDGATHDPKGIVHAGEYVFTKKQVKRLGLDRIEAYANSGDPSGDTGGPLDFLGDILLKGARKVAGAVLEPLRSAAKALVPGGNVVGDVLRGTIDKLVDGVLGKSDAADKEGPAGGGPLSAGAGWAKLFATIKGAFPNAHLNEGYANRPGYHGMGRAVDLGEQGFMGGSGRPYLAAMAKWIRQNYPNSTQLIYTGAGGSDSGILNGRPYNYGAATNAGHRNHVHWAMANGGVIQEPVNGIGMRTGATYSFGERGPETVVPGTGLGGGTIVKVYLDGKEWRGIAQVEAQSVVVGAFNALTDRGGYNP